MKSNQNKDFLQSESLYSRLKRADIPFLDQKIEFNECLYQTLHFQENINKYKKRIKWNKIKIFINKITNNKYNQEHYEKLNSLYLDFIFKLKEESKKAGVAIQKEYKPSSWSKIINFVSSFFRSKDNGPAYYNDDNNDTEEERAQKEKDRAERAIKRDKYKEENPVFFQKEFVLERKSKIERKEEYEL